jgi:hypothetical protein
MMKPCADVEADFGELHRSIAGRLAKVWMFVMRVRHSGQEFLVAYGTEAQVAFLEGQVLAFQHLGGSVAGCASTTSSHSSRWAGVGLRTVASV